MHGCSSLFRRLRLRATRTQWLQPLGSRQRTVAGWFPDSQDWAPEGPLPRLCPGPRSSRPCTFVSLFVSPGDSLPLRRRSLCHPARASEAPPLSPEPKEARPPHRVSWIEGIPGGPPCWPLRTPSSESSPLSEALLLLPPPIPELDSLSASSVEDEGDGPAPAAPQKKRRPSSAALPYKVLHRLSAVGSALSGLLSPERRLAHRVQELAQEPTSYLGGLVQSFVGHVLRGAGGRHPTSTDLLQEIRQMLSCFKGYLCESSELRAAADHGEAEELDLGMGAPGAQSWVGRGGVRISWFREVAASSGGSGRCGSTCWVSARPSGAERWVLAVLGCKVAAFCRRSGFDCDSAGRPNRALDRPGPACFSCGVDVRLGGKTRKSWGGLSPAEFA